MVDDPDDDNKFTHHPEFYDNDRDAQRLKKAVALQGEFSLENLEKAYQDLNESGLLEVKGDEAGVRQEEDKPDDYYFELPGGIFLNRRGSWMARLLIVPGRHWRQDQSLEAASFASTC